MEWSPKQELALKRVSQWFNGGLDGKPHFYVGGYAGTGKTTLARHFAEGLNSVAYAAFTGKAALQMRRSGCVGACTIHSLIYKPVDTDDEDSSAGPSFELNRDSELRSKSLLILDECSMVNDQMRSDLLSFNVPILVLGDPGQLPPVKGTGAFTGNRPDVMLDEVHRQALESPIIRIATDIRNGKVLGRLDAGEVQIYPIGRGSLEADHEQLLCGRNDTRTATNDRIRRARGYIGPYPCVGERLICLRNNRKTGVFNGLIGTVTKVIETDDVRVVLELKDEDDGLREVQIHETCFTNPEILDDLPWRDRAQFEEFTFAYAITVHKSQGSQWDSVGVIDDGMFAWDKSSRKKWLYTAVTRAQTKLTVVRKVK